MGENAVHNRGSNNAPRHSRMALAHREWHGHTALSTISQPSLRGPLMHLLAKRKGAVSPPLAILGIYSILNAQINWQDVI